MKYFEDLTFLHSGTRPTYNVKIDKQYVGNYNLQFILSGDMYYSIDDGSRNLLNRPTAFWHHPNHTYHLAPGPTGHWHHHWVTFHGPRAKRIMEDGFMTLSPMGFLHVHQVADFTETFMSIIKIMAGNDPSRHTETVLLLERLLGLLEQDAQQREFKRPFKEEIDAVAKRMQERPCDPFDFQKEARKLGMSYSYWRHLFRQYQGRPPQSYLLVCRMRYAANRLQAPDTQIKQIAFETGYDAVQFSRMFHSVIGLSPKSYRDALTHR